MSLIRSLWAGSVSDLRNPQQWLIDSVGGRVTQAGEFVSAETALSTSAYFACMHVISEDVGKLPLITYRRLKRGKERAPGHELFKLLRLQPNPEMHAMTFRETITAWAMGWGDGFAEIERPNGTDAVALHVIHPSRVTIKRDLSGNLYYEVRSVTGGQPANIQPMNMLHIHGFGPDGLRGYPISRIARESIGLTVAAESFGATFFGHGANSNVAITHPAQLSKKAKDNLKDTIRQNRSGPRKAFNPWIIEEGAKLEKLSIPPEEAQFLGTRQFQIEDICRWFRCPPHKIQHLLRATFSNIAEQGIDYLTDTLLPWLTRWEEEIQIKLFGADNDEYFAEHLADAVLRASPQMRGDFFTKQFAVGAMSPNEIAEAENRNPVAGGDQRYVPLNMRPVEESTADDTEADPPANPDEEPQPPAERNPAEEIPPETPVPKQDPNSVLWPVFLDVAQRVERRDAKAMASAVEKYKGNRAALAQWADTFFDGGFVADVFAPAAGSYSRLVGRETPSLVAFGAWYAEERKAAARSGKAIGNAAHLAQMAMAEAQDG